MPASAARRKPNDAARTSLAPLSLKDAPAFIERQFPVGRLSAEAYKERKAGAGQTLTALGSYWKGRKPLVLVRAVVLGCLLPATDDRVKDLDIFLKLMAMDDKGLARRVKDLKASDIDADWPELPRYVETADNGKPKWLQRLDPEVIERLVRDWFPTFPYERRIKYCLRPEELEQRAYLPIWPEVNAHLGTNAHSLPELVEQLGIARFGHRPKVTDTFCGGGSIPFEAARLGCDVYASDLNPIACMLTWGAFNIIGTDRVTRGEIEEAQRAVAEAVDAEITRLGIEHDEHGNRAKAFLYCLETRCPKTGWMVPVAPTWIISKSRNVVAKLVPDRGAKRYNIEIHEGATDEELKEAAQGTERGGRLVHPMNPEKSGVELKTIRGDFKDAEGNTQNRLRRWERSDFLPRADDIFQERLYAIQWIRKDTLDKARPETFFASVGKDDHDRERKVEGIVRSNLARWQEEGCVPDVPIEPGAKTDEPIRTRGWTYWHHLFGARGLLTLALFRQRSNAETMPCFLEAANFSSRLCRWRTSDRRVAKDGSGKQTGGASDDAMDVFSNQALNTLYNYAIRSEWRVRGEYAPNYVAPQEISGATDVAVLPAADISQPSDVWITDPPYADAVNYHEITEFFIAWLRKNPPPPFDAWIWDSQRKLAIKGRDEEFRRAMVEAYAAMTRHMPDNGVQVVMFTHQDAGVWADLGAILWAAGLRVVSAWNVATETTSALKDGNYVQGTICLVLRKRLGAANARRMEIEAEIEDAVRTQVTGLTRLSDEWKAEGDEIVGETLYTDGDLTLAAYAAALQVVTAYSTIDRQSLDRDLYRKLAKGEKSALRELIDYAAQVANGILVPEGFPREMWRDLDPASRFYVRMLDLEDKGTSKLSDFQDFARSFAFGDYTDLMASTSANSAKLAGAEHLKGRLLDGDGFAATPLRKVLFAIWKTIEKQDPKLGVTTLRTDYAADYWQRRQHLIGLAEYIAAKTKRTRPAESAAAGELAEALKVDRV
jgi:putative DNA methylase